ncbi:RNA helicase [Heracleum sosnowskyi]|uniref:RNA helicase n=1 Tax=Heracleum sosnowskyi TaxID=360622 RepID=A0AAD8MT71_9APIA|nr:RNA helicase [Heracleum sosnowskyi]
MKMPLSPILLRLNSTPLVSMSLIQSRTHFSLRFLFLPKQSFNLVSILNPPFSFARPLVSFSKASSTPFKFKNLSSNYLYKQSFRYGRYAYDEYDSEHDSDRDVKSSKQLGASTLDNIEEWKWKLSTLIRNKDEQEVVSREKKDRRDFQQISALAARMGLCSQQYSKVIVISKVPLPNYRSDLDDRRPQREVILPYGLEEELVAQLKKYIVKKSTNKDFVQDNSILRSSTGGNLAINQPFYEQEEPIKRTSPGAERILQRRSLEILNKQQSWQNSSEGQKMLEFRKTLPAYKEKDSLLNLVAQNQVVVVSGETGCGKTTQLPQYILESEVEAARGAACSIICTQPRRISAMSVAERVAAERGENLGESVGYKVRLEGMKGRDTRLLFCTTGILLRRLLVDRMLKGVTHVIVDEIHERGMNEDFLLIVLKDLLPRRPELRLILMSATLNADLFSSYFGGAPMIHIPGFTYPVRSHFLENILEITGYRLTTDNQIDNYGQDKMWKMQKQALRKRKSQIASAVEDTLEAVDLREYSLRTRDSLSCWNPDSIGFNLIEHVLCHICRKERPGAVLVFMTGWDDINSLKGQLQAHPLLGDPSKVLLLGCHGSMDSTEQRLIFNKPEEGIRKIVLATNMAETSITINDVVFVVDCGKAKETSYDALNNTPCLLPTWISKASARQRRGRAGRVQSGECFHLYPRCVHDAFADYQLPELLRTPLQSLCLQIKSLQLGSISEFLSRALQAPEPLSVQNAVEYLKTIGALDEYENLTVLGQKLSVLPVEPKLGKMLILGAIFNCLNPIMTVVAGLSVRDPFLMPFDRRDLAEASKAQFSSRDYSDHLALIRAYEGLYPGICSVVNKDKSISLKTMEDGPVLLHSNSVNAQQHKIPYPWLVFNEKVKVNSVMLRDSTAVCDSMVLLFGGSISRGGLDGHLKMLGGYLEFFMKPGLAETYLRLRKELEELIQNKLLNPKLDINDHNELLSAVRLVVADDRCDGKFVYGRHLPSPSKKELKKESKGALSVGGGDNAKNNLQTVLSRAGHEPPIYKTKQLKNNKFRSIVMFNGLDFVGQPCNSKKLAEKDAASEALQWLIGENEPSQKTVDHMSTILKKSKRKQEVHPAKWR